MFARLPHLLVSSTILLGSLTAAFAEDVEAWRLFVGDQQAAKLTVLDVATANKIAEFPLRGYVTHLVPSESRRTVFAVQMDADAVHVVRTGVTFTDHGEHRDVELQDPAVLLQLEGKRPVHAVPHGDQMLQFFDREGEARVFDETALLEGNPEYEVVRAAAPHHGIAVPLGDYMLVSEPDLAAEVEEGELPPRLGLKVLDGEGRQIGDTATCTGLHGEAGSGDAIAFGCEEGVLIARKSDQGAPELKMLAYGEEMPEGRVGTLLGGRAMQFFLGNYGDDKIVIIDPSAENPFRLVQLPVRRVDFALDPERVTKAYIFTEDGKLHVLDVLSGKLVQAAQVTEPYSKDGHWRDPRPRLAVMGDEIAVTDPRRQKVRILDADSLKELRAIPVEGLPFNIVAIGGSAVRH